MRSQRRQTVALAAGLLGLFTAALLGQATQVQATGRPPTWSAFAEASGLRVSVVKPAALPTADELAGLSAPFARAETDSAPSGRAVASWLWPGEGVADVKSLVLIGLDPSAAQSEVDTRKQRRPGTDGCAPERTLEVPAVPNPNGGPPLVAAHPLTSPITGQPVYDPMDNPCGEVGARTALLTITRERVPDYPFWSRAAWPPNRPEDVSDQRTLCDMSRAFPRSWELPEQPCPSSLGAERSGSTQTRSTEDGDWATSRLTDLQIPGVFSVGSMTALSRTEWVKDTMVSSASVTLDDLDIASVVHFDSLVSHATSFSDHQRPRVSLQASGVTVTIAGAAYEARLEKGRIVVVDRTLPGDVQRQITAALDAAMVQRGVSVAFGGVDPSADASAAGARTDSARHAAKIAAATISLTGSDALNGASTVRLSLGVAETDSFTQASGVFVPPVRPGGGPPIVMPGSTIVDPFSPSVVAPPIAAPSSATTSIADAAPAFPASHPIPVSVMVFASLLGLLLAVTLVVSGIWETLW